MELLGVWKHIRTGENWLEINMPLTEKDGGRKHLHQALLWLQPKSQANMELQIWKFWDATIRLGAFVSTPPYANSSTAVCSVDPSVGIRTSQSFT